MKVQKLNQRQARQALYLSRFNFNLKYIPGVRVRKANRLSKRQDLEVGIENNNENQKLIKEKWIREMIEVVVERPDMMLVEKIKRAREKDEKMVSITNFIQLVSQQLVN